MEVGCTRGSLRCSCCLIAKPVITSFVPGAIDHVRDKFGPLQCTLWGTNSLLGARNVSYTQAGSS